MAKEVRTSKILATMYQYAKSDDDTLLRDKLRMRNNDIGGPFANIALSFESRGKGAYTHLVGKSDKHFRIVIGGGLVSEIAKLPESFTDKEKFRPYWDDIIKAIYGLNYHEMGHIKFTDMKDQIIVEYPIPKYRGFLHSLFNIIEDPIIEVDMSAYCKEHFPYDTNPKVFFDFMIERIFMPQAEKYKDDKTINGFMNYLLLVLRCGKSAIKGTNAVFEKYSEDLMPQIKTVIYESNPTDRLHKCVALGEWIIEHIKEFSWEEIEIDEKEKKSGTDPTGAGGDPVPGSGGGTPGLPPGGDPGVTGSSPGSGSDKKSSESESDGDGSGHDGDGGDEAGDGSGSGGHDVSDAPTEVDTGDGSGPVKESMDDIMDEIDETFIDSFHDGADHEWVIAKDEYEVANEEIFTKIEEQIEQYKDSINDVSKFLTLFHGRTRPRRTDGFTRGRLNVFRAMQDDLKNGCDTKLFTQDIKRGKDADLAVSLLCDNSGSMSGTKSTLASQAALVLAQACEWAKIPFECNAFTKTADCSSGTSITIIEKSFEETFDQAKPYFAINDSNLIRGLKAHRYIPTFAGNSEEINLYYIWKKFTKVDHKTKLLFVMCDGGTTGSRSDLKHIVQQMEEDGIIVIAIGICNDDVVGVYSKYKIFKSTREMQEGLADYLVDTLSEYAV